jgi:hypothetical protein
MIPIKYIFHAIIVPLSILIPLFIFIFNYKFAKKELRVLFYYLIISGLINLIAIVIRRYHVSNLPLLHLYTLIEGIFLLSYFRIIFNDPIVKKVLLVLIILFPIVCILNFTFLQSIYTFNTYTRPLEAILITFFCMLYLYKGGFTENWINKPVNWINMGILIYFPAACIIFILSNYLITSLNKTLNTMVWNIHAVLILLMYLFWAKGFSLLKNGR